MYSSIVFYASFYFPFLFFPFCINFCRYLSRRCALHIIVSVYTRKWNKFLIVYVTLSRLESLLNTGKCNLGSYQHIKNKNILLNVSRTIHCLSIRKNYVRENFTHPTWLLERAQNFQKFRKPSTKKWRQSRKVSCIADFSHFYNKLTLVNFQTLNVKEDDCHW